MTQTNKPDYLAKVKQLSAEEAERLLSRIMGSKLERQLEKNKISKEEASARQMELEDKHLQKWRKIMLDWKAKEEAKKAKEEAKKAKEEVKKAKAETKKAANVKVPSKPKSPAKAKTPAKTKVAKKS